jgi:thiamine-phosphate diphosphorylase
LFINDAWQLAREYGAYGVHLGQEDLAALSPADRSALRASGLRLGISTHSYLEAAFAHAWAPSYVALGPIFATTCKAMRFGPQGLARIAEWKALLPYPLVVIGGMTLAYAAEATRLGASGVAVIRDVLEAADPGARAAAYVAVLRETQGAASTP